MKNDVFLELGATPEPFFHKMIDYLGNNLDQILCRSVANLLSLDYIIRLNQKPELHTHINNCIRRLQKYLGTRVVLDHTLMESMELFIAAITEEDTDSAKDQKSQEQLIDALIESTIAQSFGNLSPQEQVVIRSVLKEIINSRDKKELLSMISSNPNLLQKLVMQTVKAESTEKEIAHNVTKHMKDMLVQSKKIDEKQENIKTLFGKIAVSAGLLFTASLGMMFSGLLLPAMIVPAAIIAIKITPPIGKKIANKVIENNPQIMREILLLRHKGVETLKIDSKEVTIEQAPGKEIKAPIPKEVQKQGQALVNEHKLDIETSRYISFEAKSKQQTIQKDKGHSRKM
jgi:hypothetical protein